MLSVYHIFKHLSGDLVPNGRTHKESKQGAQHSSNARVFIKFACTAQAFFFLPF
jgi:hypothetical protein